MVRGDGVLRCSAISCVRSSMLRGSETWPVRKENVVALQRAEMRMVRWMCGIKLKDRFPSKELHKKQCLEYFLAISSHHIACNY